MNAKELVLYAMNDPEFAALMTELPSMVLGKKNGISLVAFVAMASYLLTQYPASRTKAEMKDIFIDMIKLG